MKTTAIVLAGGRGSRMKSEVKKQFLMLGERPVLYYSLAAFQKSPQIDEIVLVCAPEDRAWCRRELLERYALTKVSSFADAGKERYHSVYAGLKAAQGAQFVLIHDGARPFVSEELIARIWEALQEKRQGCAVGVPVKDTIKQAAGRQEIVRTLPRETLWAAQTPQAFPYEAILSAYEKALADRTENAGITDDAMAMERYGDLPVKMIPGSYDNLKLTTPEDLLLAELILSRKKYKTY